MNTRTNADVEAGHDVQDAELAGLSEEERAALAPDADEQENLAGALKDLGADGDEEEKEKAAAEAAANDDALKAFDEKAAADKAAAEKAAADAAADAEYTELAEASRVAKEAAEASAKAAADAKKAADDAEAKRVADEAAAAAAAAASKAADDEPFAPAYTAPPVVDYDKKSEAFNTRLTEASEKFKAGDLSIDAYNEERDTVERERRDLDAAKLKADIASEQQVQSSEQRWAWEINRFYRRVERDEAISYGKSSLLLAALDTRVKELANDKANADKDSTWFLEEAHRQVKTELGIGKKTPGEGDAAAKAASDARAKADAEAKAKAAAARKPDRKSIPKDLGGLPAGGKEEAGGEDEFATLDALDGIELENALARLPKEKADRYLTGR